MPDPNQKSQTSQSPPSSSSSSSSSKSIPGTNTKHADQNLPKSTNYNFSGQKVHYPNPPEATNPDPATLREQWRFAIRQYSRWYSHAWGTAILAGLSFFALGWAIKGSNPLPSFRGEDSPAPPTDSRSDDAKVKPAD